MLKKRILSGIIGIPLALFIIYMGGISYTIAILVLAILGLEEYNRLSLKGSYTFPRNLSFVLAFLYFIMLYSGVPYVLEMFLVFLLFPLSLYFVFIHEFNLRDLLFASWGMIYIIWLFGFLIVLRDLPEGLTYTLLLFIAIWLNDIAAFFVGSYLGKHKLIPRVSPNKTIEGAAGGLAVTVIFVLLFRGYINFAFSTALLAGLLISIFGQAGDLVESAIKRSLKVKDSGDIIPGHGGILDRFDSVLFVAPILYFYIKIVLKVL